MTTFIHFLTHPTLIIALAVCLVVSYPVSAGKKTDRELVDLTGPVKTVHTEVAVFYEEFGRWVEGRRVMSDPIGKTMTYVYDNQGRITTCAWHTSEGKLERRFTYKYNDAENVKISCEYSADGTLARKTRSTYNSKGKRLIGSYPDVIGRLKTTESIHTSTTAKETG